MWLRIPVELLARNNGGGSASGGSSGSAGAGGTGGSGNGSGGSDGTGQAGGSGDGTGDGAGGDGDGIDPESPAFKAAVTAAAKAEAEKTIEARLQRDRQAREADTERQKQEAAAQALKDNAKFEELAKTRETQLAAANATLATLTTERDGLLDRVKAADEAIGKILAVQIKDLPGYLKPLLDKMTPAEQLTYLADNAESIKKGATQAVPNHSGTAGAGTGTGGNAQGMAGFATTYIGSAYGQRDDGKK